MPKINKEFNQAVYVANYHREHYKKITAAFTKAEAGELEQAAEASGLTRSAYIKQAVAEKIDRDSKNK